MRYSFILLAILCTACGTALPTVKPYKLDVQQGNVVTSKMLLQLRPGMTKSQVRFIMGTPLIQDSFHDKRWDYVYQLRENGKVTEQRRVILDFENELLKSVRGDVVPTGSERAKETEAPVDTGTRIVKPVAKPEEKGLMDKLKFWEKDDASLANEKAAKEAAEAKAKADAAAKAPALKEAPAAADEPKSMLAVPLDMVPAAEVPALAAPVVVAPVEAAPAAAVPEPAVPPKPVTPKVESTPAATVPPVQEPVKAAAPESPSGMQLDKALQATPEESAPEAKVAPRAGNKTIPQPKDLPEENSPGFFDRMLEKIGF